jgi:integration host factor subunit beta
MTKSELVAKVAQANPRLTDKDAELIVSAFFSQIAKALAAGGRAEIRGFGAFFVKRRRARDGRNPHTGAAVNVPAKHVPAFRGSSIMVKRLNGSLDA